MSNMQERFTIKEGEVLPTLQVYLDDKELSIAELVRIANQLANGLLEVGTVFKIKQGDSK